MGIRNPWSRPALVARHGAVQSLGRRSDWSSLRGRKHARAQADRLDVQPWKAKVTEWFESQLLDHDVCSNYGNWNYAAGIGNDPRENRKFNMIKQAMDYDGEGKFVRLWVEELGEVKGSRVHTPWTLNRAELEKANVELGVNYPKPMLVAPEWSRHQGGKSNSGQKGNNFYSKPADQSKARTKKALPKGGRIQF